MPIFSTRTSAQSLGLMLVSLCLWLPALMASAASFSSVVTSVEAVEGASNPQFLIYVESIDLTAPVTVPITLRHITTKTGDVRLNAASIKLTPEVPSVYSRF